MLKNYTSKDLEALYNLNKYYIHLLCLEGKIKRLGKTKDMLYQIDEEYFKSFSIESYKKQRALAGNKRRSDIAKAHWSDKDYKNKQRQCIKLAWTEEKRAKQARILSIAWTKELREQQSILQKKKRDNPEFVEYHRKRTSEGTLRAYQENPELHDKLVKANKIKWSKVSFREKRAKTIKERNTKESSWEKESFDFLYSNFKDVIRQYYDKDKYPFRSDFYIPSLDLFIECHYSEFHQYEPFDAANEEHLERLKCLQNKADEKFKQTGKESRYHKMIYTWTDLDVRKRQCAEKNNLNIQFFYSKESFYSYFNNYLTELRR